MAKPTIGEFIPVFGIESYEDAVAHYIDWLGFTLDWEWREAPDEPVTMSISRDKANLMLSEDHRAGSSWIVAKVADLEVLAEEWNSRRPTSVSIEFEEPYDIPLVSLLDPFGNRIDFQGVISAEEEARRQQCANLMREYIHRRIDGGHACPTPEEVVEAVGRPPGLAMEVLCEFAEYQPSKR